jgi:hypothetical protein
MARLIALLAVLLVGVPGCGKQDESLAKQTGNKVGETLTDFASGVDKGVDKQMAVNVELSKSLVDAGISTTIAKSNGFDPKGTKGISVYMIASKPLKGKLTAKALNKEGQEIGRATADVDFAADDAKYIAFVFDSKMDTQLVDKYAIYLK